MNHLARCSGFPKQPKKMVVVGSGAIGVEFAYFYNAFGTSVTVIEMIPFLGGVIGSILTIVGLGLLVQYLMDTLPADSYENP